MESVSLILIMVGAVIIGVVLLLRLGLRHRDAGEKAPSAGEYQGALRKEPEFDPLFAVDALKDDVSDGALAKVGGIVATHAAPQRVAPRSDNSAIDGDERLQTPHKPAVQRGRPRVAEDPHRVVVLNVMAVQDRIFSGSAVRAAVEGAGFQYGDWQIFHYYAQDNGDAPPLFSLANMVKPGKFDLDRMGDMKTAGLSLFMVPAGAEGDIAGFDTMLNTARRLARELGGEVRDGRRSVLTRQAIGHIREQLSEWRCKAMAVHH